eukprot:s7987_g3.t1
MDPGARPARTRPPLLRHRVPPLQMTASGRRYPAQRLSPRPGAGQPLRSGSRASAPRAPLTKQAIRTSRYRSAPTCTWPTSHPWQPEGPDSFGPADSAAGPSLPAPPPSLFAPLPPPSPFAPLPPPSLFAPLPPPSPSLFSSPLP